MSAQQAAIALGRGEHCARVLACLAWQFIVNCNVLPINPYGKWKTSMLADENLADDIQLHLQELGSYITADKLVRYLKWPDVRAKHGILHDVSLDTAR
jgi:hypothetical protein